MPITLQIPDEIVEAMQLPGPEKQRRVQIELGCALYAQQILSSASAARLAGLSRLEFLEEAGKRQIPRHYTASDLQQDLQFANGR